MRLEDIEELIARTRREEGIELEFKKTTAERESAMQTLCAFLNTRGGRVIFGITPEGRVLGQQISDQTIRELTDLFPFFEPAAAIALERVPVEDGDRELLVASVTPLAEQQPYAYRSTPYYRAGSTTRPMPQSLYQELYQILVESSRIVRVGCSLRREINSPRSNRFRSSGSTPPFGDG